MQHNLYFSKMDSHKEVATDKSGSSTEDKTPTEVEDVSNGSSTAANDDVDDAILRANGHEAVLRRQFKWVSGLGLAFSITNSWIGYLVRASPNADVPADMLLAHSKS